MKNKLLIGAIAGAALVLGSTAFAGVTYTPVIQGGTGTTTPPAYGQVLVGNTAGTGYDYVATSTFSTSYTAGTGLTLTGSAFSLNLGNANTWSALQTFGNASTTNLTVSSGNIYGNGFGVTFYEPGFGALFTSSDAAGLQAGTGLQFNGLSGGSASAPLYAFPWGGSGMYQPAQDTVAFSATSQERLRIASNGNIGIASSSPGSLLSVGSTNGINFSTATSSFSSTGGIDLASGCFAIAGVCVGGSGTVTSVAGTGTVNGLTLTGTVTTSGSITLGGTLAINNADWSGTDLSVSNGGTGASTLTGLVKGNGTSAFTAATNGTDYTLITAKTCSSQVLTAVTAAGVFTCASLANLTATDSTLTFSGTYNGFTARTIGLNLGNANTWTGLQTFGNASSTQFSAGTNTFYIDSTGKVAAKDTATGNTGIISPTHYLPFGLATSTTWTGTSTATSYWGDSRTIPMPSYAGHVTSLGCQTLAGTLEVELTLNGTNYYVPASTTMAVFQLSGTFTASQVGTVIAGNPASTPTGVNCILGAYQSS